MKSSKSSRRNNRNARALRYLALGLSILAVVYLGSSYRSIRTVHAAGSVSLNTISVAATENFNSLINGANDTLSSSGIPTGWDFSESGTNANTTYRTGTGSGTTGDTYSFGTPTTSTDRSFGQLRSGTCIPILGASFTNNTGSTLTGLVISYAGEQWRLGATGRTIAERMDFQYSTNATSLTTGTYTDFDALDFSPPITAGTVGALDGNNSANRKIMSATITGLSIANGATFWIRWTDIDATGAEDGLGIDDFSITPLGGPVGVNGYRTTDIQGTDDGGFAMVLQPDGKIIVGGYAVNGSGNKDFALVRYNYNGTLDTTFDTDGKVTTDFNATSDRIWGLALQTDGKIVAVGETVSNIFPGTNDIAIARYNTNGSLDTSFNVTGKVTTDHGGGANNSAYGVAMQGTNIIVAGAEVVSGNYDFMVARYTTAGALDATFGTLGVTTLGFSGFTDVARAVAIDSSSRIVLGGYSQSAASASTSDFAIARFTSTGGVDGTFAIAGKAALDVSGTNNADQAFAMGIDGAGRIILAGSSYNGADKDFAFACYLSTGALDTAGFGGGTGIKKTDFANSPDVAQALFVRADGSFVAGGFSRYSASSDDFAVASYNSSGGPDLSFDTDGRLTLRISNDDERIYGIAQEFDGKIVAAGFAGTGSNPVVRDFALARFSSNGTIDSSANTTLNGPDLLTTKTGPQNPNSVSAGQQFTYTITVNNRGAVAATNVVITDVLPAGVTYVSHVASTGGSSQSSGTVTNNVGMLNPDATATLTITVTASNTPQLVANTATATLTETDLSPGNNSSTEFTRIIGLIDMSFSPSTVTGGCQNSTGTVTLSGAAPAGGATVLLQSADPAAATAPPSVLVPQGQSSANFMVTTFSVVSNKQVRFQADLGPTTFVRRINVNAGICN